jgi:Fe-S-cluster containining protein
MSELLETNLETIAAITKNREQENEEFISFLKTQDSEKTDALVHQLNKEISPKIDCTKCGNCCKTLMINVTEQEADNLSHHLQQSRAFFDKEYIEKGSSGMMLMNKIPCHFLHENKCTVYEYRPAGCREFPALHLPQFNKRLFTIFMHYDRCPIIFNVVEQLKICIKKEA